MPSLFQRCADRAPVLAIILLLVAATPRAGRAAPAPTPADPYLAAAARHHVPVELLAAVAGAESGYHPWALNIHGHEIYCRSKDEALRLLAGTDDVDIGLMQINWPFWGPRLGISKTELLDPRINLMMGARILRQMLARGGNVWRRISDYHSGSPQRRDRYNQLVYSAYLHYLNRR
ncbi:MAG TPA: lytic transglycosylase domain-containing protein [Candidatus Binataceae bacterium]|nr:lytic transglycosylase domain-containing protein [Candidatus Binataceae bacterium]